MLNLLLFLGSFSLLSLAGYSNVNQNTNPDCNHLFFSSKHETVNNTVLQLSEENETENDDDFSVQELVLPFLISQLRLELSTHVLNSAPSLSEFYGDPIYIRVGNLRV